MVLIAGNIPFQTEVASVYIFSQVESDHPVGRRRGLRGAAHLALAVLVVISLLSRRAARMSSTPARRRRREDRGRVAATSSSRAIVLTYLGCCSLLPVGDVFFRTFEDGIEPVIDALTTPSPARVLAHVPHASSPCR